MFDVKEIRRDPEGVRAALARRGAGEAVDEVLRLDEQWRAETAAAESLRASQKEASQRIAAAKKSGEDAEDAMAKMRGIADDVKAHTAAVKTAQDALQAALARLPNLPDPDAPAEDTTLREVGEIRLREGRDHLELAGERIDMERGARTSGSRFAYLRGEIVLLELALVQWALHKLIGKGFEPVIPPVLVREQALYGTGMWPDTEGQIYTLPDEDLYLVGTSEVALASLHAGEILDELPRRYAGWSSCFRREAGAAGRDTRGILRVHQFDKLEMFCFVEPDEAKAEHERLLAIEEEILQELGVPYRVVDIGIDELGDPAARKFDCEAWLPGQGRYREVTSTSNTTEFQARRLDVRYRDANGRPQTAATLNGTAATWRHMIAILENGQREDGSVELPECLRPFGAPAELAAPA